MIKCSRTTRECSVTNRKGREGRKDTNNEKVLLCWGGFASQGDGWNIIICFGLSLTRCVSVAMWVGRKKNAGCLPLTGWEIEVGLTSTGRSWVE